MKLDVLATYLEDLPDSVRALECMGLASSSNDTKSGYLFFGLPGVKTDGAKFVAQAAEKGAIAAVVSSGSEVDATNIAVLRSSDPRYVLAKAAACFFDAQPKTIAAVTGTAGKTSVATFLRQIWNHLGLRAGNLGTTGVFAPGLEDYGNLTTPDPISLHEILKLLADKNVTHLAMEASSHGLEQRRIDGVNLSVAGFTNLGHDHLDYHHDTESYLQAKLLLFTRCLPKGAPAVVFADDKFSQRVIAAAKDAQREVLTVGRQGDFISLKKSEHLQFGQSVELLHGDKHYRVEFPLAGDFQIANALVAAGMAIVTGGDAAEVFAALETLKGASGRLELVGKSSAGAPVYVDYAHKPDALENVLKALRPFTSGKIHVVFGCGGDRDKAKRPIMGEISQRLADVAIVTDDNPRSEDAAKVRLEILAAAPDAIEIGDRREAIFAACAMLGQGDCLVVAGKGHEQGQIIGSEVLPFSDHAVVQEALDEEGS